MTFHGVLLDCGCLNEGISSIIYYEVGSEFNETSVTLTPFTIGCCAGSQCCRHALNVDTGPFHHYTSYSGSSVCSGTPTTNSSSTRLYLALISGTYYLMCVGFNLGVLFYGTSATLTGSYDNLAFCTSPIIWDNPITRCISSITLGSARVGASESGIATVEVVACP